MAWGTAWRMAGAVGAAGLVAYALIAVLVVGLEHAKLQRNASAEARLSVTSVQAALGAAVWNLDQDALQALTQPLVRSGAIVRVQVLDGPKILLDAQREGTSQWTTTHWSLPLHGGNGTAPVGELRVHESYAHLGADLRRRLPMWLLAEALKVTLLAALVLWLLVRNFTRPLRRLAADVEALSLSRPASVLALDRPARRRADELDQLAAAVNRMQQRLATESSLRLQAAVDAEAAKQANRAKSEFLSRMSHELRTPMNAVMGFTDALLSDRQAPLSPLQRQRLGHVHAAGEHMLQLINDLLDLSRIESGTLTVNLQPQALGPIAAACIEMVQPSARALGVQVVLDQDRQQPPLAALVDGTRLRQVLMNLLSNAIKYNRPGGRVTVTLARHAQAQITVMDNGLGMSPQQLARLFTPFDRLGREHGPQEGTGIGLVIARHLARLMGGRLVCNSQEAQGTTVVLELPLADLDAGAAASPAAALPTNEPAPPQVREDVTGSLLVVEDNEVNCLLLELYLAYRPAVRTRFASSVDAALQLLADEEPDMALIDLGLGGRSGAEVLRAVRLLPDAARVHCVAFSADAMPDEVDRQMKAGFDDYWIKPLSLDAFLQRLDRVLGAGRA